MDFGLKGRELLQDLKRSDWLPLYNEDAVSRCLQECQGHMAQIRPALAQEMVRGRKTTLTSRYSLKMKAIVSMLTSDILLKA